MYLSLFSISFSLSSVLLTLLGTDQYSSSSFTNSSSEPVTDFIPSLKSLVNSSSLKNKYGSLFRTSATITAFCLSSLSFPSSPLAAFLFSASKSRSTP
ncbi:hypothetical protein AYI70_g8180 [Smittium culicis]|uniref:Secreted protein n=1 Tax=Smittium culicis TaxID=133412 RepID=A0A1R1XH41_9FUNG|nr:hypothetical protein AYI70_g9481 [Smittium culicis]OMJ12659.1 hypothetical protein AYI70_g8974 [Smittium culicis]OMJ13952.1 hypothetical protein AYI70_g8180 [Smittium culicis]